jgi:hypothetical protein
MSADVIDLMTALFGIGAFCAACAGAGYYIGHRAATRTMAQVQAETITATLAAALPAITQRIHVAFQTQRLEVPINALVTVRVPTMEPIVVPVETLPAPTNLDLARRILEHAQLGPRPLAAILGIYPSSAHALIAKLQAEAAAAGRPFEIAADPPDDAGPVNPITTERS